MLLENPTGHSQDKPSLLLVNPTGHSHTYEPNVLVHVLLQPPFTPYCVDSHSFMSAQLPESVTRRPGGHMHVKTLAV